MEGDLAACVPGFLRVAPEIRNKIIAVTTSDSANVARLTIHDRRPDETPEYNDKIDVSFWNGDLRDLMSVCRQLHYEVRPVSVSSITWRSSYNVMREISQFPKRYYLENTKIVDITKNLNFEFPLSLFKNLKELRLRRTDENTAEFDLSSDPVEAIRQVDWCIRDFSFIPRAKDRLLERKWIRSLLENPGRCFIVKDTINVGGPWDWLNEETKDDLVRTVLACFLRIRF